MSIDNTTALLAYQAQKKETIVAYLLWWFLGTFGAHRFYCNRTGSGTAMLVISLVSIPLCFVLIGYLFLLGMMVWWLIDAFLVAGWIQYHNQILVGQIDAARLHLPDGSGHSAHQSVQRVHPGSGPPPIR